MAKPRGVKGEKEKKTRKKVFSKTPAHSAAPRSSSPPPTMPPVTPSKCCTSGARDQELDSEPMPWVVARQALSKAFIDGKLAASHIREEILALVVSDLPHLPDVRGLIDNNLPALTALQASLTAKVNRFPAVVRDQLSRLPDVQQYVHRQLEHVPEWRAFVESKLPSFLHDPHLPEMGPLLSDLLSQCELPARIVDGLRAMPAFSSAISSSLHMDDMRVLLQHTLKDNMLAMEELRALVATHMHGLPNLQTLIHDQILSWRPSLRALHSLPDWMHDNQHIVTGYRPELRSFRRCFYSMLYVHNETGNIYSHLLGALFFALLSVYVFGFLPHDHILVDRLVFTVFCVSAIVCLGCSAVFHCCFVHSHRVNIIFTKLDYSGITALIFGSACSLIYFLLYCHSTLATVYIAGTAIMGSLCAWASFTDSYRGSQYKWVRVMLFISFACCAVVPLVHYAFMYGINTLLLAADVFTVLCVSGPLYLVGALVYITRFPECFLPGRFDYWCNSHQLWHCFVLAAAIAHYLAIYNMLLHRHEHSCAAEDGLLTRWT